jgi:hypothetical protein
MDETEGEIGDLRASSSCIDDLGVKLFFSSSLREMEGDLG